MQQIKVKSIDMQILHKQSFVKKENQAHCGTKIQSLRVKNRWQEEDMKRLHGGLIKCLEQQQHITKQTNIKRLLV